MCRIESAMLVFITTGGSLARRGVFFVKLSFSYKRACFDRENNCSNFQKHKISQGVRARFDLSRSILVLSRALSLGGEGLRRLSLHAELRLLACARGGPHALNRRTSVLPAS